MKKAYEKMRYEGRVENSPEACQRMSDAQKQTKGEHPYSYQNQPNSSGHNISFTAQGAVRHKEKSGTRRDRSQGHLISALSKERA